MGGIMSQLAVDRFHNRMLFTPDEYISRQVLRLQAVQHAVKTIPSFFPERHDRIGAQIFILKFAIAVTPWFFTVAGIKVRETGKHVSGHMFYNGGDAVGFLVEL